MELLKPLLLLIMLFGFYPLPVALVVSAMLRLGLGWSGARGLTALSGVLALPNAWIVLISGRGLFATSLNLMWVATAALMTLAGLGCWILAARRNTARFWLEPLVLLAACAYLLLAISNWIAH